MECTILGTGHSAGFPLPFCDCKYCSNAEKRRRRCSLLIEKDNTNILFDVSPDIIEQLNNMNVKRFSDIFLTHNHFDHTGGIREICNIAKNFDIHKDYNYENIENYYGKYFNIHMTKDTKDILDRTMDYVTNDGYNIKFNILDEEISINNIKIKPIDCDHTDDYVSYIIIDEDENEKLFYHPDSGNIQENIGIFDNIHFDTFVCDSGPYFGYHGDIEKLKKIKKTVNYDRIYYTHISEHYAQMHLDEIKNKYNGNFPSDFTKVL